MIQPVPMLSAPVQMAPAFAAVKPEEAGCQSHLLNEAHQHIMRSYPKMRSFLIVRGSRLIYEQYYGNHHAGSLNDLRSATKSITSTLFGMAVAEGLLPSLDTPVVDVLGKLMHKQGHPLLPQITFRHLLTMTSGFSWKTGKKLGEPLIHQFHRTRRWTSFALSLPVIEENIGSFQYRSTDSHLLSAALTEVSGIDAYTYAQEKLFRPLEISHAAWSPSPEGHSMGHVGLYLTSRDMAKFGLCCLQKGMWQDQSLIPASWLEEALAPQTEGYPAFGDYGYQWWTGKIDGQPYSLAHGHGGQQMYLFPELDALVLFTQDSQVSRWKNPRMLLEQYILPSMAEVE
ncbi:serine hydrolase domain-containing protein [Paenibacillus lemnae]|uniref:Serine hydrolase n=1 Tax=Paenibacillus lemnae TaxID=1330551 RepID=A0A848M7X8_PAELE|nr:serine hydrolase [Paenibacillus lemnae]NMO97308.1 serine hydrolase [Paenibacillus lemnae]